jgi:hypothetical protein
MYGNDWMYVRDSAELLRGPVQEADVRVRPLDHLAVELEHEPEHPVRRRMLRPKLRV